MTKSFIAAVLAASLAITSISVAPARADAEDAAKVLLGLAVIAGIAAAVDDDNDRRRVSRARRHDRDDYRPRHRRRDRMVLPSRCLRIYDTYRGERRGFAPRCLNRHARHVQLPRRCERRVRTDRGWRRFYAPRCLRREGYRFAGGHRRHIR